MMMIMGRETFHPNPTDRMLSPLSVDVGGYEYDDVADYHQLEACDYFRMYEFKVRMCVLGMSHDWTECPYAHPGEKAARRDPRKFNYSGNPCPELRKGSTCQRGDTCEFAHGVFECWLHPSRYRTQPCKDGVECRRRICFFAHTPDQIRLVPTSPMSPVYELTSCLRNLQMGKNGSRLSMSPMSCSPSSTPTRTSVNVWEEEPMMERVESGKGVRANIYAKLSRENSIAGGNTI